LTWPVTAKLGEFWDGTGGRPSRMATVFEPNDTDLLCTD
jgi:hypothetical protein